MPSGDYARMYKSDMTNEAKLPSIFRGATHINNKGTRLLPDLFSSDRGAKVVGKYLYFVTKELDLYRYDMEVLVSNFTSKKKQKSWMPHLIASNVEDFDVSWKENQEVDQYVVWSLQIQGTIDNNKTKKSKFFMRRIQIS